MKPNDEQLSALLKKWPDIEPRGSFEADVKRRIRLQASEKREVLAWNWRYALGLATVVVMVVMLGSSIGIWTSWHSRTQKAELTFMSAGTLTGGYLKLRHP